MMISGSERLSKTDRYSSGSLFGLFRSVTLRSRSLENVSDRSSKKENDQRRRRRKRGEDEEEGAGGGDGKDGMNEEVHSSNISFDREIHPF